MSGQAKRDLLAARRTRKRREGIAVLSDGREAPWPELMAHVARLRREADALELEAVTTARVAGVSWDRVSVAVGGKPTGEGLRQRYARAVLGLSGETVRRVGPVDDGADAGPSR